MGPFGAWMTDAPSQATSQSLRTFSSSSSRRNDDDDDDDDAPNPWAELDMSVASWGQPSSSAMPPSPFLSQPQQSAASQQSRGLSDPTEGLSLEEAMWLEAMQSKLQDGPTPAARPSYAHPQQSRPLEPPIRAPSSTNLTHVDAATNQASMVDVSAKPMSKRRASASGKVLLPPRLLPLLQGSDGATEIFSPAGKGPVFATARLAGLMGAKKTSDLIPLCHGINLDAIEVHLELIVPTENTTDWPYIEITVSTTSTSNTGVEMEALVGVSTAAATVCEYAYFVCYWVTFTRANVNHPPPF